MNLRAGTRLLAASVMAVAFAAGTAGVAQAAPTLTPAGPYSDGDTVTVSGTAPVLSPPVTHYAIAECNIGNPNPATWATRCNGASGAFVNLTALSSGTYSGTIHVNDSFSDANFAGGPPPGTSTTCSTIGLDQCGIVVSFYRGSAPPVFTTVDYKAIGF